jgi:hypothetical protein
MRVKTDLVLSRRLEQTKNVLRSKVSRGVPVRNAMRSLRTSMMDVVRGLEMSANPDSWDSDALPLLRKDEIQVPQWGPESKRMCGASGDKLVGSIAAAKREELATISVCRDSGGGKKNDGNVRAALSAKHTVEEESDVLNDLDEVRFKGPSYLDPLRMRLADRLGEQTREIKRLVHKAKDVMHSNLPRKDPFTQESPFRHWSRESHYCAQIIDRWYSEWKRSPKDKKMKPAMQIDSWLRKLQIANDHCFTEYLRGMGLKIDKVLRFDKKWSNKALMEMLGEENKSVGTGEFVYPGLPVIKDPKIAFGIYMAKKGFTVVDPRTNDSVTKEFQRRVERKRISKISDKQKRFFRDILRVLLPRDDDYKNVKSFPNSGKACLEGSMSQGGKRSVLAHLNSDRNNEEYEEMKDCVRADTIFTGGKFRTVTISSILASEWSFINDLVFSRLRKCKWLVAGRSVAEWVTQFRRYGFKEGLPFVSGDLAAATDNFDPWFAEEMIRVVSRRVGFDPRPLYKWITRAKVFWDDSDGNRHVFNQQWGQFMGSDFSFPALCLVSAMIGFEMKGFIEHYPYHLNRHQRLPMMKWIVFQTCLFGVNGDDFAAQQKRGESWQKSVEFTGGVPEPTKSPYSMDYFTINSQLWSVKEWRDVGTVLPAMLKNLSNGVHPGTFENWANLVSATPNHDPFGLSQLFLPEMPIAIGGQASPSSKPRNRQEWQTFLKRFFLAIQSVPTESFSQTTLKCWFADSTSTVGSTIIRKGFIKANEPMNVPAISGWVRKSEVKTLGIYRYGSAGAVKWTVPELEKGYKKSKWERIGDAAGFFANNMFDRREALWLKLDALKQNERNGFQWVSDYRPSQAEIEDGVLLHMSHQSDNEPPLKIIRRIAFDDGHIEELLRKEKAKRNRDNEVPLEGLTELQVEALYLQSREGKDVVTSEEVKKVMTGRVDEQPKEVKRMITVRKEKSTADKLRDATVRVLKDLLNKDEFKTKTTTEKAIEVKNKAPWIPKIKLSFEDDCDDAPIPKLPLKRCF